MYVLYCTKALLQPMAIRIPAAHWSGGPARCARYVVRYYISLAYHSNTRSKDAGTSNADVGLRLRRRRVGPVILAGFLSSSCTPRAAAVVAFL
jgi:hypothetical protein